MVGESVVVSREPGRFKRKSIFNTKKEGTIGFINYF